MLQQTISDVEIFGRIGMESAAALLISWRQTSWGRGARGEEGPIWRGTRGGEGTLATNRLGDQCGSVFRRGCPPSSSGVGVARKRKGVGGRWGEGRVRNPYPWRGGGAWTRLRVREYALHNRGTLVIAPREMVGQLR